MLDVGKMNKRIRGIKKHIKELEATIKLVKDDLTKAHAERFLKCNTCLKKSKTKKCFAVEYEYWDDNTGSPCGGFYRHGFFAWACPVCEQYRNNRFEDDNLYYEMYYSFLGHIKERESN